MMQSTWNGPVCGTCGTGYLGVHQCAPADLLRRAADLVDLATRLQSPSEPERSGSNCPCRPKNGGSGICGCVLGGMTITCATG